MHLFRNIAREKERELKGEIVRERERVKERERGERKRES